MAREKGKVASKARIPSEFRGETKRAGEQGPAIPPPGPSPKLQERETPTNVQRMAAGLTGRGGRSVNKIYKTY